MTDQLGRWQVHGACYNRPDLTDLFFPERGNTANKAAKQLCAICIVKAECLDYAIRHHIAHGTWGGTGERERRRIKRERRQAA